MVGSKTMVHQDGNYWHIHGCVFLQLMHLKTTEGYRRYSFLVERVRAINSIDFFWNIAGE